MKFNAAVKLVQKVFPTATVSVFAPPGGRVECVARLYSVTGHAYDLTFEANARGENAFSVRLRPDGFGAFQSHDTVPAALAYLLFVSRGPVTVQLPDRALSVSAGIDRVGASLAPVAWVGVKAAPLLAGGQAVWGAARSVRRKGLRDAASLAMVAAFVADPAAALPLADFALGVEA